MAEIDDLSFETDDVVAAESSEDSLFTSLSSIVTFVAERFKRAEDARLGDEERWLRSYRNYRGIYGPEVQFTSSEKSKVFVKVTKTKTLAAYGQIVDVLFGNNKFPLSVEPSVLPDGVAESVHINVDPNAGPAHEVLKGAFEQQPSKPYLIGPDTELKPGETRTTLMKRLGGMSNKLGPVSDKIIEGDGTTPTSVTFHPAMVAAKKMEKKIHDQLNESGASKHLRSMAFEMALLGTGVMKGPFAVDKEYPNWDEEGEYDPLIKTVPSTNHVSVWNFYPDPEATSMDDAEYVVERHKMSRNQLRALRGRPYFMDESIQLAIEKGADYVRKHWEMKMEDDDSHPSDSERWEVLEFWGFVDTDLLEENGIKIPRELRNLVEVNANIWVCNGEIIRCVLNPFKPSRIPYYAVPYEHNPYSFFGVGIAENMDDTQTLMNGFMRMAVDNAVLSGNLLIEIDETNLVPGQDLSVYPGKVFRRQGGAPGQAIFGTKFPNVAAENMQLFDKARVLADESTGFPSFAHGQTGVSGVGRTASGISMLMSAANGSIRSVVKNVDDYLLAPMGRAFFAFNMQFDFDEDIKGDLEVMANGTESLMANEVRSQRLMQFLGVVQNPALAPFAKMDYIIREIAKSMDLDPNKVTNSMQDAAIQAEILKGFQQPAPPPEAAGMGPPPPEGAGPVPAGANPADQTGAGGGTIGTGVAPAPGEEGFSGNVA
ncbi:putative portal protein [Roseobacter phage CRP-603]|nr:putative portal protein [Roseobacter phage CRP-603]